jgi:hypothetical protein
MPSVKKKKVTKKTSASRKKTTVSKAKTRKKAPAKAAPPKMVSVEERYRMVAESAYYKALNRGFSDGDPQKDWYEAEAEVEAGLKKRRASGG